MNGFLSEISTHSEVIEFIDLWIRDGYTSYQDLESGLKDKLTALYIKYLGDSAYECIIEPQEFHKTMHHFLRYLQTGQKEYALDLAETMHKNAVDYFADTLSEIFNQRFEEIQVDIKIDQGLRPITDKVNGETLWVRG